MAIPIGERPDHPGEGDQALKQRVERLPAEQIRRITEQLWRRSARSRPWPAFRSVLPSRRSRTVGRPGGSALAEYHRRRRLERAAWRRTLAWRAAAMLTVTAVVAIATVWLGQARLAGWAALAAGIATLVKLRFRVSQEARTLKQGAASERATAKLLRPLWRAGYTVLHDLVVPGSPSNLDHLVIGPTGVWLIHSKHYPGRVSVGVDGTLWHDYRPLDQIIEQLWWQAGFVKTVLGAGRVRLTPVLAVDSGLLPAYSPLVVCGIPVVAASGLLRVVRQDPELGPEEVAWLAEQARRMFGPAA